MSEAVIEPVSEPVTNTVVEPVVPPAPRPHRARTAPEQSPNLGRIVLYHQVESPQNPAIVTPAIIQAVRDTGAVRLFVFGHGGAELVDDVVEGNLVGQWSWPTAVNGPGAAAPVLTALEPDTAVLGTPSFTLHVRGTGFAPDAVIVWNGGDEPTTVVSPTEVTTGVNMDTATSAVTVPVLVRNGDGTVTGPLPFTFTAPAAKRK